MAETLSPINPAVHNVPEYTVSDISGAVKRMVEDRFGRVRVRGEISAWKAHSSGHCYFRLKDENAVLDAVCWRGSVGKIPFKPEDGMEVVATGRVTTYPGKSSYQIVVETMEPAGAGALMALLEKRKAQLAAEGLFAPERKKPLPYMPAVIGVITSPTGAVIRDILHRLADRFPCRVVVWPVAVQGEGAAAQVAEAIDGFNSLNPESRIPTPDLLIVARGGGSIEDLWAFNEEIVVRAAANSAIPLISAVGHETDTTLIDFASSRRAPTPTAAAEMAVPVLSELRSVHAQLVARNEAGMTRYLGRLQEGIAGLARGLPRPQTLLEHASQRLDDWAERLKSALPGLIGAKEQSLRIFQARLLPQLLLKDMNLLATRLEPLGYMLDKALLAGVEKKQRLLERLASVLPALDYRTVLSRGFALVRSGEGAPLTTAAQASREQMLTIQFADGEVKAKPQ